LLFASAMPRAFAIVFACALLLAALPAHPRASDTAADTLALRAGMCESFDGLAFTFCVALCEARACDQLEAGDERCAILQRGFARVAAGARPPCAAQIPPTVDAL
jgi:hypothetical protein